jgi:hypothetical protein
MTTPRRSKEVIHCLLQAMKQTVTSYHPTVTRTSTTIDGLIAGTACFPGGSGLWRGEANGGSLPKYFPTNPVMFVAHNFDSERGFNLSFARQGEAGGEFWKRLLCMITGAVLSPDECFFTNALMGLKPGKAEGEMPSVSGYKDQCQLFLKQQVEIVRPRTVIALGVKAAKYVSELDCHFGVSKHPKDWYFRELTTRDERLLAEGKAIGSCLPEREPPSVTETVVQADRRQQDEVQLRSTPLQKNTSVTHIASQQGNNETDVWGFRYGSRNSFLMKAIEAGGKSKETIKSEFLHVYPDAVGKSTFGVFFSDVIRPFGSASVSRSIRIETDQKGHIKLDSDRAPVVKAAIAKGLLKELNRVEGNAYPKKDSSAIEQILRRYGVPLK